MQKIVALALFTALVGLSACEQIGPVSTVLAVEETVTLKAESGRFVTLPAGSDLNAAFLWKSDTKKAYVDVLGERVIFRNAKANSAQDAVTAVPAASGQVSHGERVGIQGQRSLVCEGSRCETVRRFRRDQRCTRYERRAYQECWHDQYGRPYCQTRWEDVPVPGWERVEVTETTRNFRYLVTIFGESTERFASGSVTRPETESSERAVSPCY